MAEQLLLFHGAQKGGLLQLILIAPLPAVGPVLNQQAVNSYQALLPALRKPEITQFLALCRPVLLRLILFQ